MEIRELLQKELWSKRTSRKILSVVGKALRVVEVLLVVFVVLYLVNSYWLTPSERKAGRVALEKVDALQPFSVMSGEEYGADYKQAETMVHAAEEAAWTGRDKSIAGLLSNYLMFTDMRRQEQQTIITLSNSSNEHLRSLGLQTCHSSVAGNEFESALLHQFLR
jgi:hypothetical protein